MDIELLLMAFMGVLGSLITGLLLLVANIVTQQRIDNRERRRITDERRAATALGAYQTINSVAADVLALTSKQKTGKQTDLQMANQFRKALGDKLTSTEYRLSQLDAIIAAPDSVLARISWHKVPNAIEGTVHSGTWSLREIGRQLLSERRDIQGETQMDVADIIALFINDDPDVVRAMFDELESHMNNIHDDQT